MKLNFDKKSLEISSSRVITSIISIVAASNIFFPEKNWNDNVVNILNSWFESAMLIWEKGNDEARFIFFDGPFSFKIRKQNAMYIIYLLQGTNQLETFNIYFREFVSNLVKLSQEILKETEARDWKSDDLKQLESTMRRITSNPDLHFD